MVHACLNAWPDMQAQYRISRHQEAQTVQVDAPAVEAPGLHWVDLSLPLSQHLIPRQALPASRVLADSPGLPPPAPTEGWGRAGSTPAPAGQARALNPCTTLCCCRKQNSEWKPDLVSTPQLPAILTRFLVKKKKIPEQQPKALGTRAPRWPGGVCRAWRGPKSLLNADSSSRTENRPTK